VLRWAADAVLIVIPVSLTYAILKHRLLDIRLVVRRGLRYLMARRVLQTLVILPFVGLILPVVFILIGHFWIQPGRFPPSSTWCFLHCAA
jgi:hypothetical protein